MPGVQTLLPVMLDHVNKNRLKLEQLIKFICENPVKIFGIKNKGYLKEITISSDKSYFDTNITKHHHFYDEDTNLLIDCNDNEIGKVNIKNNITGKKISSVEVLVRVASDTQNQN